MRLVLEQVKLSLRWKGCYWAKSDLLNIFYNTRIRLMENTVNPLTTDDKCTCHATLAACYQLAQSVLKIGFAIANKGGIGGGGWVSAHGSCFG